MDEYRKYEPIFGAWYLKRLIGKGSFGKVFEITREEFGNEYKAALKIISVPQDDDDVKARMTESTEPESVSEYYEGILKEIISENEIMSKLKGNSNIVSYEDHQIIPHDDGIGYDVLIRMELLTPLIDRMLEQKLDEKEVVKLGIDICKALELCHRKNIIHRDIKPQNIFISENGDFKLGDFGIARTMEKTTGGMSKKGTYKYMAPEVFRGEHYDSTVDLYSLGIVLFSLLNGNRGPFLPAPPAKVTHNDEEEARMRRFRGEPIPAPRDAGVMLSYIIKKACEADPAKRYRTAEQMRRDLESYLDNYDQQSELTAQEAEKTVYDDGTSAFTGRYTMPPQGDQRFTGQYSVPPQADPRYTGQYAAPQADPRYTGQYAMPPQYGAAAPVQTAGPSGKSRGKGIRIAAIILGLLVLAGAVTFGIMKIMGGKDETAAGDPGETQVVDGKTGDEGDGGPSAEKKTGGEAPADSKEYNGHHYMVFADHIRWDQARDACAEKKGHLVYIESAEEQAAIEKIITDSGNPVLHYWLGGTSADGSWKWLSGDKIPVPGESSGYQNWEPGKPNNNSEAAGFTGKEQCLELQTTNNGKDYMKWNDIDMDGVALGYEGPDEYNSTQYFGYICEWDY